MDIGISLSSTTRAPVDEAGRHLIARARTAAEAGLASLSLGDGHARGEVGYIQNVPALGRLLAEWRGRPAGCLFLLPLWPPLLVAEQVGTLAALHDGPFIVQTGLGPPVDARLAVFNESVRVVDRLLAGEAVDSDRFGLAGVSVRFVPARPVEWWMGTMTRAGLDRAARFGAAWYAAPGVSIEELRPLDEHYRAACAEHGSTARVMLRRDVLVLRDGDRARRLADSAAESGYRGIARDRIVAGDPDDVAELLAPFAMLGVDQVVVRTMGLEPALDLESIELLAEVVPAVGTTGGPDHS